MRSFEYQNKILFLKVSLIAHSHQIKIATDWLQTGSRLASDSKISVNGTMLYQCNPIAFYQSGASLKPVGCKLNFGVNEP